jgi:hypothetical protein
MVSKPTAAPNKFAERFGETPTFAADRRGYSWTNWTCADCGQRWERRSKVVDQSWTPLA